MLSITKEGTRSGQAPLPSLEEDARGRISDRANVAEWNIDDTQKLNNTARQIWATINDTMSQLNNKVSTKTKSDQRI